MSDNEIIYQYYIGIINLINKYCTTTYLYYCSILYNNTFILFTLKLYQNVSTRGFCIMSSAGLTLMPLMLPGSRFTRQWSI